MGDKETTAKGVDEGSKGSGGDKVNNDNSSIWPQLGLQTQSYYRKLSICKKSIRGVGQIF